MKKNVLFIFALSFLMMSCGKGSDEYWAKRMQTFIVNESSYRDLYLDNNGNRRPFSVNRKVEILLGEYKMVDTAMIFENCILKFSKELKEQSDSVLKISNYRFKYSRKEQEKDQGSHIVYDNYYYIFTDSLIQNIKNSMLVKGIFPEKAE